MLRKSERVSDRRVASHGRATVTCAGEIFTPAHANERRPVTTVPPICRRLTAEARFRLARYGLWPSELA